MTLVYTHKKSGKGSTYYSCDIYIPRKDNTVLISEEFIRTELIGSTYVLNNKFFGPFTYTNPSTKNIVKLNYTTTGDGLLDKLQIQINEKGDTTKKIQYNKGLLNGETVIKKDDGITMITHQNYKAGKLNGKYESYYSNGNKYKSYNYVNGNLNSVQKEYYPDGKIKLSLTIINGKIEGEYSFYYNAEFPISEVEAPFQYIYYQDKRRTSRDGFLTLKTQNTSSEDWSYLDKLKHERLFEDKHYVIYEPVFSGFTRDTNNTWEQKPVFKFDSKIHDIIKSGLYYDDNYVSGSSKKLNYFSKYDEFVLDLAYSRHFKLLSTNMENNLPKNEMTLYHSNGSPYMRFIFTDEIEAKYNKELTSKEKSTFKNRYNMEYQDYTKKIVKVDTKIKTVKNIYFYWSNGKKLTELKYIDAKGEKNITKSYTPEPCDYNCTNCDCYRYKYGPCDWCGKKGKMDAAHSGSHDLLINDCRYGTKFFCSGKCRYEFEKTICD